MQGCPVSGMREQEGMETMEIAEVLAVETTTAVETITVLVTITVAEISMVVQTLMEEGNMDMDIGMAIGEGFLVVEVMDIRETITWEPMVAA